MLMSLKLKLVEPNVWPANSGFDGGRSRLYPQGPGPGTGGGRMAARGDDISILAEQDCLNGQFRSYR